MSWGWPLTAAFLVAGLLIVALYWLRERRLVRAVPNLALFDAIGRSGPRPAWVRQLRHPVSLLLQLILLGLLALALARRLHEPAPERTWIWLVDAGPEMAAPLAADDERSLLTLARARLSERVRRLGPGERALLIEVGARPKRLVGPTAERSELARAIEVLEARDATPNLPAALELAGNLVPTQARQEAVVFAGPALRHHASSSPRGQGDDTERARLSFEPLGASPANDNLQVRSFAARRYPLGAGRFEATLVVSSTLSAPVIVRAELARVTLPEGREAPLEVIEFPVAARAETRRTFVGQATGEAALSLRISRSDGHYERVVSDNVGRTVLVPEPTFDVLVVGEESLFLTAALLSSGQVSLERVAPGDYPPRDGSGRERRFDLTVFRATSVVRSALTGSAIYLGARGAQVPVVAGRDKKMFGFDESDRKSPLFRFFDPFDTQVLQGFSLLPGRDDRVHAWTGGEPLVVSGVRAEGPFLALGFVPEDSDMVLRSAFPLFVRGALELLVGEESAELRLPGQVGRPTAYPLPSGAAPFSALVLEGPLGHPRATIQEVVPVQGRLELMVERAGFYRLAVPSRDAQRSGDSATEAPGEMPPEYLAFNASAAIPAEERAQASPASVLEPKLREAKLPTYPRLPSWMLWTMVVASLGLIEYYLYQRRWTV